MCCVVVTILFKNLLNVSNHVFSELAKGDPKEESKELKDSMYTMSDNACMSAKNSQLIISERNQAAIHSKWHDGCWKLFLGVHIYFPQVA